MYYVLTENGEVLEIFENETEAVDYASNTAEEDADNDGTDVAYVVAKGIKIIEAEYKTSVELKVEDID